MPWKSRFLSVLRSAFRIVKSGRTSPFGESGLSKHAWQCGPGSGVPFSVLGQACLLLLTHTALGTAAPAPAGSGSGRRKLWAAALTSQIPALLIQHQNCSVSSCLPGTVPCTIISLCLLDHAVAWRAPSWGRFWHHSLFVFLHTTGSGGCHVGRVVRKYFGCLFVPLEFLRFSNFVSSDYSLVFVFFLCLFLIYLLLNCYFFHLYLLVFILVEKDWLKLRECNSF